MKAKVYAILPAARPEEYDIEIHSIPADADEVLFTGDTLGGHDAFLACPEGFAKALGLDEVEPGVIYELNVEIAAVWEAS